LDSEARVSEVVGILGGGVLGGGSSETEANIMEEPVFKLQLEGLQTFNDFVAIVRGKDLNDRQLREMTARLSDGTTGLSDAEQADAGNLVNFTGV